MVDRLGARPLGTQPHVVGRHQAADALGRIPQDRLRHLPRLGRERRHQPLRHLFGQLVDQPRAVVGRHRLEHAHGRVGAQVRDQFLLTLRRDVREGRRRQVAGQEAEAHPRVGRLESREDLRHVRRVQVHDALAQLGVVAGADQLLHLGDEQFGREVQRE